MDFFYKIARRAEYLLHAHYRMGHHIHSPYCYHIATDILFEKHPFYSFEQIEKVRKEMLNSSDREVVRTQKKELNAKYGQLLQRLCAENRAKNIVELGTGLGINALYLSANDSKARVYSFEQGECNKVVRANFKRLKKENIKLIEGDIEVTFSSNLEKIDDIDLFFANYKFEGEQLLRFYSLAKEKRKKHSIFVFSRIHSSQQMEKAWKQIVDDGDVTLSIDLYGVGVVWFNKELVKQHYIISF